MFGRFISLPFFFLRSSTAASSVLTGLIQTFVFARVLSPKEFSVFILVGAAGFTLMLCDLGIAKILFVRLRAVHLEGGRDKDIANQTTAVVLFYIFLAIVGSIFCFALMTALGHNTTLQSAEFALFFLFTALNLAWFALRNVSIAVDEFIFFEILEVVRRAGNVIFMLALLFGFPVIAFVIAGNLLWATVLVLSMARLMRDGALAREMHGLANRLFVFFKDNRRALVRSATYSISEIFAYNFPFLVVPIIYGLGAPTIILDTTFKVFRAGSVAYSAACDLLVSRQTTAFSERDAPTLVHATMMAVGLCAIPASLASIFLIVAGKPFFAFLLGPAAIMPPVTIPLLIVLLFTNLAQMVMLSLLVHSGFFKEIAKLGPLVAIAMALATTLVIVAGLDIIGFLLVYTGVYTCGAALYVFLAFRGPIRIARRGK